MSITTSPPTPSDPTQRLPAIPADGLTATVQYAILGVLIYHGAQTEQEIEAELIHLFHPSTIWRAAKALMAEGVVVQILAAPDHPKFATRYRINRSLTIKRSD